MARQFWPGQNPIGHHFRYGSSQAPEVEVVGVARDGKYAFIAEDPRPYFYVPLVQDYRRFVCCTCARRLFLQSRSHSIEDQCIHSNPICPFST